MITIGILGGGQLGRMAALAAARLGMRVHTYTPEADASAARVSAHVTVASWHDTDALSRFAVSVDVITVEREDIPELTARHLAQLRPIYPNPDALAICQDRIAEKRMLARLGLPCAPWYPVHCAEDVARAHAALGTTAVLKSARQGYDGRGQVLLDAQVDYAACWSALGATAGVVEAFVRFTRELSVVLARGQDGAIVAYQVVENQHRDHILRRTIAPAPISSHTAAQAERLAYQIAQALDYVGVMAVEMFQLPDEQLLINEVAPRPHNSGHWTLDAAYTCQFEQHVRAICGLPLGSTTARCQATMDNLLGEDLHRIPALLADPTARLHLYDKLPIRPTRKMGHVTFLRSRG